MQYLHTMIRVANLDTSLDFFTRILGFVEQRRHISEKGRFTLVFVACPESPDCPVELTYNSTASFSGAKTAIVKTMDDEYRLRNLEWIEGMRKRVDEATNGEVGYIYVPSTGLDGQSELMRQFNAQWNKKALIISALDAISVPGAGVEPAQPFLATGF